MGIKYNQKQRKKRIHEKPFLNMHYGDEPCNSSLRVLFCPEKLMPKRKKKKRTKFRPLKHENPWNPNNPGKKGKLGTLEKFPKYKEDPPKQLVRNIERENYDGPIYL